MWNVNGRFTKRQMSRTLAAGGLAALIASGWVLVSAGGQGGDPDVGEAARTLLASTPVPEGQREAVADGVLTYAEYEAAVLATVACAEAAGLRIIDRPHADPSGKTLLYSFAAGLDLAEAKRSNAIHHECYVAHLAAINIMWSAQNTPTEDVLAEARQVLTECLRKALPEAAIPNGPIPDSIRGSEAFLPCVEDVQRRYGLPGFGG
jgi:hypothetical protein